MVPRGRESSYYLTQSYTVSLGHKELIYTYEYILFGLNVLAFDYNISYSL